MPNIIGPTILIRSTYFYLEGDMRDGGTTLHGINHILQKLVCGVY